MKINFIKGVFVFITVVVFASVIIISCTKNDQLNQKTEIQLEVKSLVSSHAYTRNINYFKNYGEVNFAEAIQKQIRVNSTDSVTLLVIPIYNNSKVVASIEAIRLPKGRLPNNDEYAMNLIDLREVNLKNLTGKIQMIDINYDYYNHSTIYIENNLIKFWNANGLSSDLKSKYNDIQYKQIHRSAQQQNQIRSNGTGIYTLCDSNGDHNISFSECYKCATDAISADGFSQWVCDFPILGWLSCWVSKTAACIYVAAAY